jgi:phenylpropionate dioxygenase-like ring-hydroxylating dioxygenase large terminal subunit
VEVSARLKYPSSCQWSREVLILEKLKPSPRYEGPARIVRDIVDRLPDLSDASAGLLPPECYTSPEFFEFERSVVFSRSWICVGRVEQVRNAGDCISAHPAGEPILVVRTNSGDLRAMAAICRHRGQIIPCTHNQKTFRCPLHAWTYDLEGKLIGAPRMDKVEIAELRKSERLERVRLELWHGFIFVNLDRDAAPLAPSLAKVEPFWAGYESADLVGIPPRMAETPVQWNWKVQLENFTDAYHTEFVHRGTHEFAPSVTKDGGVVFTEMMRGDNAIIRTVPMLEPDGGMMEDGWGKPPAFPPITTISSEQRQRLTFVMIPPSMTMVFAPNSIAFTLISATAVEATYASSDRQTAGGWLLPRSSVDLPDFEKRAAMVLQGGAKIWAQDVPENLGMQKGKKSRFAPKGVYGPLEKTLIQFNAWLIHAYMTAIEKAN